MSWKGFRDVRATICIDTTQPLETLRMNCDKDARWGINKALKEGLAVSTAEHEKEWEEFYKIYLETLKRGGIQARSYQEIRKEHAVLFLCKKEEKIIAGAVALEDAGHETLSLFLNASLPEFLPMQPNNLLYGNLITYGKEQGFKTLDLGGYQLNAKKGDKLYEINRFKERWGGTIVTIPVYSKNPFYIIGRKVIRNFPLAKKLWDRMKR